MNFADFAVKEFTLRKTSFMLGSVVVALVTAGIVVTASGLQSFQGKEKTEYAGHEIATKSSVKTMERDYETITRKMGFTHRILPQTQNEADFFNDGFCRRTMAQSNVDRIIGELSQTFDAIVPVIRQKVWWPEARRSVFICGVGTVAGKSAGKINQFLTKPVDSRTILMGFETGTDLHVHTHDAITIRGTSFAVGNVAAQQGSIDDITLWMTMNDAQRVLSSRGLCSEVWVWAEPSDNSQLSKLARLGKVVEMTPRAAVRARSLITAARASGETVLRERQASQIAAAHRGAMQKLVSLALGAAALVWIVIVSFINAHGRMREVGILRALGVRAAGVVALLAGRTCFMGLTGALLGCVLGCVYALASAHGPIPVGMAAGIVASATALSMVAGIVPACMAVARDPASILIRE